MPPIYVEDASTWPAGLLRAVRSAADDLRGTASACVDLRPGDSHLWLIRDQLTHVRPSVFHATRLLPHELDDIATSGLRLMTRDLVEHKLKAAFDAGALTSAQSEHLLAEIEPLHGPARRADQACASATTRGFREDIHGVWRLLTYWGGEVIYWRHGDDELGVRLRTMGAPAVIELTVPAQRHGDAWYPALENLLIGAVLGLDDVNADVYLRSAADTEVVAIHTPGTAWWDAFPQLPRA